MNGVPFITQWSFLVSRFLSPSQEMFVDSYLQAPPFCSSAPCFILIPRLIVMIAFIPSSLRSSSSFHCHTSHARSAAASPKLGSRRQAGRRRLRHDVRRRRRRHVNDDLASRATSSRFARYSCYPHCNVICRPFLSPALCCLCCVSFTLATSGRVLKSCQHVPPRQRKGTVGQGVLSVRPRFSVSLCG